LQVGQTALPLLPVLPSQQDKVLIKIKIGNIIATNPRHFYSQFPKNHFHLMPIKNAPVIFRNETAFNWINRFFDF
jgi:hypothetical protein